MVLIDGSPLRSAAITEVATGRANVQLAESVLARVAAAISRLSPA